MKHLIACFTFLIAVLLCHNTFAQGWQWGKSTQTYGLSTPGDDAWGGVAIDKSGNFFQAAYGARWNDSIIFGTITLYNTTHRDQMYVSKIDSNGNYLWAIANDGANAAPMGIVNDVAGNLYVLGVYDSSYECIFGGVVLSNPSHLYMYFISKISPTGTVLWSQNIAGIYTSSSYCPGLHGGIGIDNNNNVYASGNFNFTAIIGTTTITPSGNDIFLVKYDSLGNNLWAKDYICSYGTNSNAMTVGKTGNIYMSGIFGGSSFIIGSTTLSSSISNKFLAKFDSSGNPVWAKNVDKHISYQAIAKDANENFYLTGFYDSTAILDTNTITSVGSLDVVLSKYDSSGNVKWVKSAGGNEVDKAFGITIDTCGKLFISGQFGHFWAFFLYSYNMYFGSSSLGILPNSPDGLFIAEYDNAGNYITSFASPSGGDDYSGLAVDNKGNFYISGDYISNSSLARMIFGSDTLLLDSLREELFIAKFKYDSFGCQQYCLPTKINGANFICEGSTTVLGNPTPGGIWSSSNTTIATIGSTTGVLTGISTGSAVITYTLPMGCIATTTINVVNSLPNITGAFMQCIAYTTTALHDTATYGTWSSSNTAIVAIDSFSGGITCVSIGVATITYTVASGCFTTESFTVNGLPAAISGSHHVCEGGTSTLTETSTGGYWRSSNTAVATVDSFTGVVTGLTFGISNIQFYTGCAASLVDTVIYCPYLDIATANGINDIQLYPIPAHTLLQITAPFKITQVEISNLLGQTYYNQIFDNNNITINTEKLPNCIYTVKINGIYIKKLIKE